MSYILRCAQAFVWATFFLCLLSLPQRLRAETFAETLLQATYLTNVQENTRFSKTVLLLGMGGYELADGTYRSFYNWYNPSWTDLRFDFMTQLNESMGLLWSVSTGERGQKYRIDSEFRAGLMMQFEPFPRRYLSFLYTRSFGGTLRELPCEADYGDLGGVQRVNCRLAASMMSPQDTLQYLLKITPGGRNWFGVRLRFDFQT